MAKKSKLTDWLPKQSGGMLEWKPEAWLRELRNRDEDGAYKSFTQLEAAGCDREKLARLLHYLQVANESRPVSRTAALKALKKIKAAREVVDGLGKSALGFGLQLANLDRTTYARHWGLGLDLHVLERRLEAALPYATQRANVARARVLVEINRYVRKSTGAAREGWLQQLLPTVLHEPDFSWTSFIRRYRRDWKRRREISETG